MEVLSAQAPAQRYSQRLSHGAVEVEAPTYRRLCAPNRGRSRLRLDSEKRLNTRAQLVALLDYYLPRVSDTVRSGILADGDWRERSAETLLAHYRKIERYYERNGNGGRTEDRREKDR